LRHPRWTNYRKTPSKQRNSTTSKIQTPKDSYPLTDLDIALPKLDKLEAIEAKKPPPPEAAACLGSFGAMVKIESKKETQLREEKIVGERNSSKPDLLRQIKKGMLHLNVVYLWKEGIVNNEYLKNNSNIIIICREQQRKQWFWLAVLEFEKSNQTEWKVGGCFFVEVRTEYKSKKSLFSTRL